MEAATATTKVARPPKRRRSAEAEEKRLAAKMVSPSLILIAIVAAYPIGYAVWLSLNEYSVRVPGLSRWAGLRNYETALESESFQKAIGNTFIFTVGSVTLELLLGIAMALAMHSAFKGKGLLRTVVLVPWAVLTVVCAITWQTIFEPQLGFVNTMLRGLGLPGGDTVWLGEQGYAMAVLIFADVWKTAPFMALLILAGLQVIPNDVYDAAKVDGANAWKRFTKITLPLLKPAILVALIFRTLDALRIFDLPFVLTKGANGTNTVSLEAYEELRENRLIGLGSAMAVITFILVMIVSFLYIRFVGGNIRGLAGEEGKA
jgi:multiple sugar transport system permease protein